MNLFKQTRKTKENNYKLLSLPELIVCVESGSVEGSDSERLSVTPPLLNLLYLQFGGMRVGG